jgi:hypothetical protein
MKTTIYISGFVAAFLLLGWVLALLMNLPGHLLMLITGSIVLLFIYLPLVIRKRKIHRERMKEIIQNYKRDTNNSETLQSDPGQEVTEKAPGHTAKGWSMNNSPFRERNAGATWGGGNIHAANATRNPRKKRR